MVRNLKISALYILLLAGLAVFYGYPDILFKKPQSIHKWRQSDCASLALNYYQGGMHFFQPQTHNLTSDQGRSGYCCPSEIPILYYGVAILYKLFGPHDFIFRFLNMLLFFMGLFYLFKTYLYLLKDVYWSVFLSLLFFTAPVLVYYGNSYLSNTAALSFSIAGWYFVMRSYFEQKPKWLRVALLLFFLAAAFKLTSLMSLLALLGIELFVKSKWIPSDQNDKWLPKGRYFFIWNLCILSTICSWILYAKYYNQVHDCSYFSTTSFPIWELHLDQIKGVLENVKTLWLDQYFHYSVYVFFIACTLFYLWNLKHNLKLFNFILGFLLLQLIGFIVLQFWTFADHDYYVIDLYIFPILFLAFSFYSLSNRFPVFFQSYYFKAAFMVLLFYNMVYARQELQARYSYPLNDYESCAPIYQIKDYLNTIGVQSTDRIISIPDFSHASLYLMNLKGWTEYTDARFNKAQKIPYNQDSAGIQLSINKGAHYLILNGLSEFSKKPYLKSFCKHLIGQFETVLIFDLRSRQQNFDPDHRELLKVYYCDAETRSPDGQHFINPSDSIPFEFGQSQSSDIAHHGKYSAKLQTSMPYGMTLNIPKLIVGELYVISIWRKSDGNQKAAVIASSGPNEFYSGDFQIVDADSSGWEQLQMQFEISKKLEGQELKIYAFNPENQAAYFDDLKVERYDQLFHKPQSNPIPSGNIMKF